MIGKTLTQLLSSKRWQREGLITLDQSLFERVTATADWSALQSTRPIARNYVGAGEEPGTVAYKNPAMSR